MPHSDFRRSPELLCAGASRLLIVDMQEKLLQVMKDRDGITANCIMLIRAANLLNVPATATEQYPKGLGSTASEIAELLGPRPDKLRFSCREVLGWQLDVQSEQPRQQVVIAGIEAHVCVLQSAFDLLSQGFEVFVAVDAVASRKELDQRIALQRMSDGGIRLVTTEMVLFEWSETAGTDLFKQISRLVTRKT